MSVTHVAGPTIGLAGRVIQRCAVCGEKLCDNLRVAAPLNPDGTPPTFPTWKEGSLVTCSGSNPRSEVLAGDYVTASELPADFCLALVE